MEIGIVGLRGSGKTTLFNLLTGLGEATGGYATESHVGIARVPDGRLDRLAALYRPRKTTHATVRYVDIPGLATERGGAPLDLPQARTTDALMVVLHGFSRADGPPDPLADLAAIEAEFLIADQVVVERRLDRLGRELGKRRAPELEAERAALERCLAALEAERPLREAGLSAEERRLLKGFTFLSLKPMLVVLNLGEDRLGEDPFAGPGWAAWREREGVELTAVCATFEGELARLEPEEAAAFMADAGIEEPALDRVLRASYRLLDLVSFFTVGEDECRAWPVPAGTTAVEAAGAIHSDIQRGFIRAEVVRWDELLDAGSLAECRRRGTLRLEGKGYVVRDGDVIHFRFNV